MPKSVVTLQTVKPTRKVYEAFQKLYSAGIHGINVTVPHKLEALEACDIVDPAAQIMGAVNTIVFDQDGKCTGFNTDGPGFARAIREEFSLDLGDLKVIIVGAGGGAGRARPGLRPPGSLESRGVRENHRRLRAAGIRRLRLGEEPARRAADRRRPVDRRRRGEADRTAHRRDRSGKAAQRNDERFKRRRRTPVRGRTEPPVEDIPVRCHRRRILRAAYRCGISSVRHLQRRTHTRLGRLFVLLDRWYQ